MNAELVGILALITAQQATMKQMELAIAEDNYYQRPVRYSSDDFGYVVERLNELYIRAVNAG